MPYWFECAPCKKDHNDFFTATRQASMYLTRAEDVATSRAAAEKEGATSLARNLEEEEDRLREQVKSAVDRVEALNGQMTACESENHARHAQG